MASKAADNSEKKNCLATQIFDDMLMKREKSRFSKMVLNVCTDAIACCLFSLMLTQLSYVQRTQVINFSAADDTKTS
jgi:hypothetical protein